MNLYTPTPTGRDKSGRPVTLPSLLDPSEFSIDPDLGDEVVCDGNCVVGFKGTNAEEYADAIDLPVEVFSVVDADGALVWNPGMGNLADYLGNLADLNSYECLEFTTGRSLPEEEKEVLGEGGYGKVYKCWRKSTNVPVAVKILNKGKTLKELSDFQVRNEVAAPREFWIYNQLLSDNIIEIFDAFEDKNYIYIVMEYHEDGRLKIGQSGIPSVRRRRFTCQLLEMLACLKQLKVHHNDIKKENLLLSETSRLVLCDFGVAKYSDSEGEKDREDVVRLILDMYCGESYGTTKERLNIASQREARVDDKEWELVSELVNTLKPEKDNKNDINFLRLPYYQRYAAEAREDDILSEKEAELRRLLRKAASKSGDVQPQAKLEEEDVPNA